MAEDARFVSWLEREHVHFEYRPSIRLTSIDEAASRKNQGRIGNALNEDMIAQYHGEMERGAIFPALVVYPKGDRYVILDGNQRYEAYKRAGRTTADAYVVTETDTQKIELLARTANLIESAWPPSKEDRLAQAEYWHRVKGVSVQEAARLWMLDYHMLLNRVRAHDFDQRSAGQGARMADIPLTIKQDLAALPNDHVMLRAAEVIAQGNLAHDQARGPLQAVRKERTEADQIAAVDLYKERPEVQAQLRRVGARGRARGDSRHRVVFSALSTLDNILRQAHSFEDVGCTAPEDQAALENVLSACLGNARRLQREKANGATKVVAASHS